MAEEGGKKGEKEGERKTEIETCSSPSQEVLSDLIVQRRDCDVEFIAALGISRSHLSLPLPLCACPPTIFI